MVKWTSAPLLLQKFMFHYPTKYKSRKRSTVDSLHFVAEPIIEQRKTQDYIFFLLILYCTREAVNYNSFHGVLD